MTGKNIVFHCKMQLLRLQTHWKASLLHSAIVWPVRFNSGHIHTGQNLQPVKDTLKRVGTLGLLGAGFEFVLQLNGKISF
jgi:hypothetical protein